MKKSLLILVVAVFMAATIGTAFAGPFSDVPKSHWAYEAIQSLAAKGLLEGYADGKFKGTKAMTRYEMALMVARLIDKKFGGADFDTLQKLTVEFADELALLGVKVQALEEEVKVVRNDVDALKSDVDMLKKGGLGKIKLTIEDRIRFEENKYKNLNAAGLAAQPNNSRFVNRLRMNIKGQIDDNVSAFISLQDSTVHGTGVQNNPVNGANTVNFDTNRDLYLGYVDIKNFGGEVIDNARIGRMTLTIGKAFIFDNEIDGLMIKKHYRGTNFSLAGFDTRGVLPDNTNAIGLPANATNNDGLDSKLFTIDHSWTNVSAGAYYLTRTNSYYNAAIGAQSMNVAGLTLDGKIGKSVVAFLEYATMSPAKNKDLYTATPVTPKWKGNGFKFGGEWTVNPTWNLSLLYQEREKDFLVLSLNDDYTDSAYATNGPYSSVCDVSGAFFGVAPVSADRFNNSKIASFIIGYKATEKLNLDLWYEDLKGKDKLNAAGTLTGNFDQSTTQLVSTYQYKENTAFKLRYRTTKYKTGDADYVNCLAGTAPADHDQVRLDLNVKF